MSAHLVILPSGRPVLDTGKVQIGLRHGEAQGIPRTLSWHTPRPLISRDAERLQAAMLCGGAGDTAPRAQTPAQPPERRADWLDDEELQLELARRDYEALEYIASGLPRLLVLAAMVAILAIIGVIGWLGAGS
jgi:hypothetical protein